MNFSKQPIKLNNRDCRKKNSIDCDVAKGLRLAIYRLRVVRSTITKVKIMKIRHFPTEPNKQIAVILLS